MKDNSRSRGHASLLIADPDPSTVGTIQSFFRAPEYRCVAVAEGQAVFDLLSERPFSLVLCSLQFPDIDGIEVLQRSLRISPQSAVLVMGTSADWGLAIEALRLGAYDFLEKPFRRVPWIRNITRALRRRRLETDQRNHHSLLEEALRERTEHLHNALEEVEESQRRTLETLAAALDAREHETHLHSLRVEAFTLLLAEKCGYSSALMRELRQGALLHDIGKIVVPDSILLKPGRLTPEEYRVMQQHSVHGHEILARIPHLQRAAMVALSHHERVDGRGYPAGLAGDAIPLEARIFAIADTLDVITAGRPYRAPRSLAEARVEILRNSGQQFDADVVDVFLGIGNEVWRALREQVAQRYQSASQPLFGTRHTLPHSFPY
jgi:putative nucleotidyltransferase with HDIG domain